MNREVVVLEDGAAVARAAALRVTIAAAEAVTARGRFTLVLAGGSTPGALYRELAASAPGAMPWSRTLLFWGDERCVAPDHEWSNYRMAREVLLDRIPIPPENVQRMHGEHDPTTAARAYEHVIRETLREVRPQFDLVLLGMGDDGHTASLFPGMPALSISDDLVVSTPVPAYVRPQVSRLTLTYGALNAARQVLFLVTGESKQRAAAAALGEERPSPEAVPAARVAPAGRLTWLMDRSAAATLRRE